MDILKILGIFAIFACFALVSGCEDNQEPQQQVEVPAEAEQMMQQAADAAADAQTMCPVMDAPINKEYYVEYEGKKVYFCCPGCDEKFLEEPEKYLGKLPQFE